MKKNEMTVKIYLDQINYLGDVIDSTLIAQFRNMAWAANFIKEANNSVADDKLAKIRVEVTR